MCKRSLFTAILLAALMVGGGCSRHPSDVHSLSGRLRVSLVGTSTIGLKYRLADAQFDIVGSTYSTSVHTDDGAEQASIVVTLPVGNYSILLVDGWQLERATEAGGYVAVEANLVGENPQEFEIKKDLQTSVVYSFRAGSDVIQTGEGQLVIAIEVEDSTFVEIGAGSPVRSFSGGPGLIAWPSFVAVDLPNLLSGLICDRSVTKATCRPATSTDRGVTWLLHDSRPPDIRGKEVRRITGFHHGFVV
jgi:hypothetical protein